MTHPSRRRAQDPLGGKLDFAGLEHKANNPDMRRAPQVWQSDGPGTPAWWLRRLLARHQTRRLWHEMCWDYYEGRHPLPFVIDDELLDQFHAAQYLTRTNYLALVLEALEERCDVEGFRSGGAAEADTDAWDIWQANDLDELSQLAHVATFVTGVAYTLTWPGDDGPQVWVEDSLNMVHEWDLSKPRGRHVAAAAKVWHDDQHRCDRAELYLADGIHRFVLETSAQNRSGRWVPQDDNERFEALPDEFLSLDRDGLVPVTPLIAHPDRHRNGRSELTDGMPVQLRINQTIWDRLVAQSYTSIQQLIAVGVTPDIDEETGQATSTIKRGRQRVIHVEEGADVKALPQGSIATMLDAVDQDITALARLSRTPPNYLSAKSQFPSGDAIRSAEAGLVKKARRRMRQVGGGWERTMRLALAADGRRDLARDVRMETIWASPEIRTEGELVDAIVKMSGLGVPVEALWERWGATQVQIARWRTALDANAFARGLEQVPELDAQPALPVGDEGLEAA
jgi:hypothetical protein